jgi:hypothetical protein
MRRTALVCTGLVLWIAVGCGGTSTPESAGPPPGCGMVPPNRVVGLVGTDVRATARGSLTGLRDHHRTVTCTTVNRAHPQRYVLIKAQYHPKPLRLSRAGCSSGQIFAGTPDKYAPACQEIVGRRHTTRLTVRWQPYVMDVTVSRLDPYWAGDAELGLSMSRLVAQRLDVAEAAGLG